MRKWGAIILILGMFGLILAMNMDTTVTTPEHTVGEGEFAVTVPQTTVHNIGLMDQRRSYLIFSGIVSVIGAIFIAAGFLRSSGDQKSADLKPCPYCAEPIRKEAALCRYCGKDIPKEESPAPVIPPVQQETTEASFRTCDKCRMLNPGTDLVCSRCGHILELGSA